MESFTDTVRLRRSGFRLRVIDVIDCQVELIVIAFRFTTVLSAPVCQNSQDWQVVALVEREYSIVEQVSRGNRRLGGI